MDDDNKSPAFSSIVRFQSRDPEKPTAKEPGNQSKLDREADAAKAKAAFEEVLKKRKRAEGKQDGQADAKKSESEPPRPEEPAVFNPEDLTQVAGIVGRLIDWISAASFYPNRPLALGAALMTVGTLIGRGWRARHAAQLTCTWEGSAAAHPANSFRALPCQSLHNHIRSIYIYIYMRDNILKYKEILIGGFGRGFGILA